MKEAIDKGTEDKLTKDVLRWMATFHMNITAEILCLVSLAASRLNKYLTFTFKYTSYTSSTDLFCDKYLETPKKTLHRNRHCNEKNTINKISANEYEFQP